ncbi:Crp/Fnr family transcriptional regulator [Spirochaetota bacterium]
MKDYKRSKYKQGSFIYIEGNENVENIYIVEKGEVELKCDNVFIKRFRNIAHPGDIIGFISSLSNHPHIDSAIAKTETTLIVIPREDFLNQLHEKPDIAVKVINYFADELRSYNESMLSLDGNGIDSDETKLFRLGKYNFDNNHLDRSYYILKRYLELYPDEAFTGEARELLEGIEELGFTGIDDHIIDGVNRKYNDKQIIFCENEPGEELYIIKEGNVKIIKNDGEFEILLSILKEGDIFGELAIISDKLRNATAIAYGSVTIMPINKDSLDKLLHSSAKILRTILVAISQRVWFSFIRLESRLYEKPATRIYAFLENKLLEEGISLRSDTPHQFGFGINELLKMNRFTQDSIGNAFRKLVDDPNLSFNFHHVRIQSPAEVSKMACLYRKLDHLEKSDISTQKGESSDLELNEIIPDQLKEVEEAESILTLGEGELDIDYLKDEKGDVKKREKFEFDIPRNMKGGLYEVYIEDDDTMKKCFSKNMKPGQLIRFIYQRLGEAKITIMCDDELVRVMRIAGD